MDFLLFKGIIDDDYLNVVDEVVFLVLWSYFFDVVIYDVGVDIYEDDDLGYFNISMVGVLVWDWLVINVCK